MIPQRTRQGQGKERLVLIDGNAILHRAYHALPPLTTSKGEQIGAVFGFCSMLLKVIQDLKPDYLAVAFDRPKPTFRQQIYVGYQAQRPKMAEDLTLQVELVHRALETMGIPTYEVDGFEADDVIGTLARQAVAGVTVDSGNPLDSRKRIEIIIVSGDRDMFQLVSENIKIYAPIIGLTKTVLYDEKGVLEKYGIEPSQMVDFKALVGDPSDNYPGVAGIGPKTASSLLKCFSKLEQIYGNLDKLDKKLADKLVSARKEANLAKNLATIVTSVPIKLNLLKCRLGKLDKPKVVKLFEELEFKSLIPRLKGGQQVTEEEKESDKQMGLF